MPAAVLPATASAKSIHKGKYQCYKKFKIIGKADGIEINCNR